MIYVVARNEQEATRALWSTLSQIQEPNRVISGKFALAGRRFTSDDTVYVLSGVSVEIKDLLWRTIVCSPSQPSIWKEVTHPEALDA